MKHFISGNTTLFYLSLHVGGTQKNCDGALLLREVIEQISSTSCKALNLWVPGQYVDKVLMHTGMMLRANYDLEQVAIGRYNSVCDAEGRSRVKPVCVENNNEIDFLLETNELGRGKLFKGDVDDCNVPAMWMDLFKATENDLSSIYYLVRSHPLEFSHILLKDLSEKNVLLRKTRGWCKCFRRMRRRTRRLCKCSRRK